MGHSRNSPKATFLEGAIGNEHTLHPWFTPNPEAALQTMASCLHEWEHSQASLPTIQKAGGVVLDNPGGERPPKRRYFLEWSFPSLDRPWSDPILLTRCAC